MEEQSQLPGVERSSLHISTAGRVFRSSRCSSLPRSVELTRNSQVAERAEAAFKKKEERLLDGQKAMAEYRADRRAVQEKTARLRALRLARDSADKDRKKK
jgi:hypothetical protein